MPLHKALAIIVLTEIISGVELTEMLCSLGGFHMKTLPIPEQTPMLERKQQLTRRKKRTPSYGAVFHLLVVGAHTKRHIRALGRNPYLRKPLTKTGVPGRMESYEAGIDGVDLVLNPYRVRIRMAAESALAARWPAPSLEEVRDASVAFCGMGWDFVDGELQGLHEWTWDHQMPHRCFEVVLIATLLRDGFGFDAFGRGGPRDEDGSSSDDDGGPAPVSFAVEVGGMELEWTLGYALASAADN